jgi:hypothetical protein
MIQFTRGAQMGIIISFAFFIVGCKTERITTKDKTVTGGGGSTTVNSVGSGGTTNTFAASSGSGGSTATNAGTSATAEGISAAGNSGIANAGKAGRTTTAGSAAKTGGGGSIATAAGKGGANQGAAGTGGARANKDAKYAIIVKAGGTPEGSDQGPDTISSATYATNNIHTFSDCLATYLKESGVTAQVFNWVDCANLSCIRVPNETSTASIVVFAGATYGFAIPPELTNLIPAFRSISPLPKVTSVISMCMEGACGIENFITSLNSAGLNTIQGAAIATSWPVAPSATDMEPQMETVVKPFAQSLVTAAK